MTSLSQDRTGRGILFICGGIFFISVNDMLIKLLSGDYPLHQIVFARSVIGLMFTLVFVHLEGGWRILRTDTPGLHLVRGLMVVLANMTFYAAVAVMPLAQATALFFVAPLFITLLSIPLLGEKVGALRLGAVVVGFGGVLVMQQPWTDAGEVSASVLALPVLAAAFYALMQVLTRRLGVSTPASAMAIYIQTTFITVSLAFFLIAGDGRFVEGVDNESLIFLLRAWVMPPVSDWWVFGLIGVCAGMVGYALSSAYKLASAGTIAPFEYLGLPLAIFWGWAFFREWPEPATWVGCALIIGAGLFVFLREKQKQVQMTGWRRRWGRR